MFDIGSIHSKLLGKTILSADNYITIPYTIYKQSYTSMELNVTDCSKTFYYTVSHNYWIPQLAVA